MAEDVEVDEGAWCRCGETTSRWVAELLAWVNGATGGELYRECKAAEPSVKYLRAVPGEGHPDRVEKVKEHIGMALKMVLHVTRDHSDTARKLRGAETPASMAALDEQLAMAAAETKYPGNVPTVKDFLEWVEEND